VTLEARFAAALMSLLGDPPPARLGVAVSGGGDSVALLHLLHRTLGTALHVVTVDHGLRPESGDEAATVARAAQGLDLPHDTLRWTGWDGQGNLQDAAREARLSLIADWARDRGIDAVALGHTRDDQAETVLMRLARGSGVDGLGGIPPTAERYGIRFLRPLLGVGRQDLRDWLSGQGIGWIDDPSNDDPSFDRVRARQAIATLGLDPVRLSRSARQMRDARDVLRQATAELADRAARQEAGDLVLSRSHLTEALTDTRLRLLAAALCFVSGQAYRPRWATLERVWTALATGEGASAHGCLIVADGACARIAREPAALPGPVPFGTVWDRWTVEGPGGAALTVGALESDGLAQVPDWRALGLARSLLITSPAVRQGDNLIAAPLAGLENGYTARLLPSRDNFRQFVLSH